MTPQKKRKAGHVAKPGPKKPPVIQSETARFGSARPRSINPSEDIQGFSKLHTPDSGQYLSATTLSKLNAFKFQPSVEGGPESVTQWKAQSSDNSLEDNKPRDHSIASSPDCDKHPFAAGKGNYRATYKTDHGSGMTSMPDDLMGDCEDELFEDIIAHETQETCNGAAATNHNGTTTSFGKHIVTPSSVQKADTGIKSLKDTSHVPQFPLFIKPKPPVPVIFRATLPAVVPTLSPIPDISPNHRIPTCFRIGEVVRLLSSTPTAQFSAIELYTRVKASVRQADVQTFLFTDIFFPQQPPYLTAIYRRWSENELFEQDTSSLITDSGPESSLGGNQPEEGPLLKKCRAIIRPSTRLSGPNVGVMCGKVQPLMRPLSKLETVLSGADVSPPEIEILSIWECSWDDVSYCKGIVEPGLMGDEEDAKCNKK